MPGLKLLPAAPGSCPVCATKHTPEQPHNNQSLHYQMWFHGVHGRWPTWADAMAHCDEPTRQAWQYELTKRCKWTEPDDGKPIASTADDVAKHGQVTVGSMTVVRQS